MNFICEKETILKAINSVINGVASKTTMPILEGILIQTNDNEIKLTTYDLEIGIEYIIEAKVKEQGSVVVNATMFSEIIRKLPNKEIRISINDNNLLEEVKKIETKVEQMLYYARSEVTEKDYFVKELNLNDILHPILLNYKNNILKNKVSLKIAPLNYKVYTDEKWLTFIISQIIENSLKYFDKKEKLIEIDVLENKNNIILIIKDNGAGIKESDLKRVFDKGFTGTNRKKEYSTGIGLYLAKKLCERLNLDINISSIYKKYTKVEVVFPKTNIYKMN